MNGRSNHYCVTAAADVAAADPGLTGGRWFDRLSALAVQGGIFLAVAASVAAARLLHLPQSQILVLWLPAGVVFAAMMLGGIRCWPAVLLGLATVMADLEGRPALPALGCAVAQTCVIGAAVYWLRHRAQFHPALARVRDVAAFAGAAIGTALAISLFTALGIMLSPGAGLAAGSAALVAAAGYFVGVLLIAPPLLTCLTPSPVAALKQHGIEFALLLLLVNLVAASTLVVHLPPGYPMLPFVIWAGLRFGPRETSLVTLDGTLWVVANCLRYDPRFKDGGLQLLLLSDGYMALLTGVGLVISGLSAERNAGYAALRAAQAELELRVAARTAELAQANQLLLAAKLEAEQANQAKSDSLATMSHEIRNPLNGILGCNELMLDGRLSGDQRLLGEKIRRSGRALLAILNDVLDFSKIEAGRLEFDPRPCSPRLIGDAAVQDAAPAASERRLGLFMHCAQDVPQLIEADATRICQILANFISNAIKCTELGSVTLRIFRDLTDPAALRFEVVDTGAGIDPERQHLLFHQFTQLPGKQGQRRLGTGLGLAISKRLAEAMPQGRIGVISSLNQGSIFWFSAHFPVIEDAVAPPPPGRDAAPPASARPLRVLVAEDGLLNQEVIQRFLTAAGHRVVLVSTGRHAVEVVSRARFDVILMDIEMPEMDGLEATRRIRAMPKPMRQIPIIAVTGNVMASETAHYRRQGINHVVAKPVDRSSLLQLLANVAESIEILPDIIPASPNGR